MFVNKVVLVVSVIWNAREAAAVKVAPEATVICSVRVMHARVSKVVPEEAAPKVEFNRHDLCNSVMFVAVCQQSPLYCKQLYIYLDESLTSYNHILEVKLCGPL